MPGHLTLRLEGHGSKLSIKFLQRTDGGDNNIVETVTAFVVAAPGSEEEVWASTCGWVYRSADLGEQWTRFLTSASIGYASDGSGLRGDTKAVLLENHGVLAFGADAAAAARANLIVEESAQMAIFAEVLGGARNIPANLLKATVERRDEFARAGSLP